MNSDYTEDREPLDTKSMLEETFFKNLKTSSVNLPPKKAEVIKAQVANKSPEVNTEELLIGLFEVRDNLIESFQGIDLSSDVARTLTDNINKLGSCIGRLGGTSEKFDPLANASGLQNPNLIKNAERVIENTKDSYTGEIEEARIEEENIIVSFGGKIGETVYKAIGTIASNGVWVGNEAVDYVYTPGEGKMSVKALNEQGQWIDKSNDYKISWVLEENDLSAQKEGNDEQDKSEKKEENIEEVKEVIKKTISDEEIGNDFPIEEK